MLNNIKMWARNLKKQIYILYFAYRDERVSWYAKIFTAFVVAYAFSPIDLIPDFIPILGYLDDVVLIPLGIMLAMKMIPKSVVADSEVKAEELMKKGKPKNWVVGLLIIFVWILILIWFAKIVYKFFL